MNCKKNSTDILRVSRFVHLLRKNKVFCLLHTLSLKKVYGNELLQRIYETFSQPQHIKTALDFLPKETPKNLIEETIFDLKNKGFLISHPDEDINTYLAAFSKGITKHPIQLMYLIPTTNCNFRCKYCFVGDETRELNNANMTKELARKSMEVFAKLTGNYDKIRVIYYGGEPLLNAEVVYSSMRYIRKLEKGGIFKKPVEIAILTNGSLVDDRTVKILLETNTEVSISIDGPEKLHDAARLSVSGEGTFQRALAAYKKLEAAGAKPSISCTLNQFNINNIDEIVDFIINDLKVKGMGFNLLIPRIDDKFEDYNYEFATNQLIRAFKVLREHGIYEDRMMRRVKPYAKCSIHFKDCLGVGGQIVVSPDGRVGPCQAFLGLNEYFPLTVKELHSRLPEISYEDIYKEPLFNEWHHRFPLNMEKCWDCVAIAVCGGGCPYVSQVTKGSIWEIDERVCYQPKQILEWMIWDTYDHLIEAHKTKGKKKISGEMNLFPPGPGKSFSRSGDHCPTDCTSDAPYLKERVKLPDGKMYIFPTVSAAQRNRTIDLLSEISAEPMEPWFRMKFYDDLSDIRPESSAYYKHYVHNFVTQFFSEEKVSGKKVLDLGCGPGFYSAVLAQRGAKVTGIDQSKFLIDKANEHKARLGLGNVEFVQADFLDYSSRWSRNEFDYVIAIDTMVSFDYRRKRHDHERVSKAFSCISRILKDDARFFIIEAHPCFVHTGEFLSDSGEYFLIRSAHYKIEYKLKGDFHHWFTLDEMTRATSENCLAVLRIYEPDPSAALKKENPESYSFRLKYPGMIVYEICKIRA